MDDCSSEEQAVRVAGNRSLRLRPIRTDDAQALVDVALLSTKEDLRLRFFGSVRPVIGPLTTLLTQFDRDRHIAVAVYDPAAAGANRTSSASSAWCSPRTRRKVSSPSWCAPTRRAAVSAIA